MKSKLIILSLLSCLLLTACGHEHVFSEATCTTAPTCECGELEGEALGHTWSDATCISPKSCTVCGTVEGEALGHTWLDATCEAAMTCSVCGTVEGEPLGHTWLDATYEAPKTCELCGLTEGLKIPKPDEHTNMDMNNDGVLDTSDDALVNDIMQQLLEEYYNRQ